MENSTCAMILTVVFVCSIFLSGFYLKKRLKVKGSGHIRHNVSTRRLTYITILESWNSMVIFVAILSVSIWIKWLFRDFSPSLIYIKSISVITFLSISSSFCYHLLVLISVGGKNFKSKHIQKEKEFGNNSDINSDKAKIEAISKILTVVLFVSYIITVLDFFGVPTGSILALGGFGSIVLGFAAKDILSDLVSAVLLFIDNQFGLGDWIKLETPSIEGVVEDIGWRVCRIRTFDNRPLYVPNSLMSKAIIQNVTRRDAMRIKEYVTVDVNAADRLSSVCKDIKFEITHNPDGIDPDRQIVVAVSSFEGGVCWIYISAHTYVTDMSCFHGIRQALLLKVATILKTNDIKIKAPRLFIEKKKN
ncbi:mechanosensitive ion channel family protein [Photobacterium kishitanii]|uniref:Mechanosensitive ion channel family protein n=1 Tax=Photobacterium kishitanii TaxID=318456 RepID=A0A2T3KMY0_9GAMM|nr:mechanosensitive ion channel domain-containing protein [Photobacterium kishitanii]PSV01156.1 hypothetical protein C9J27_03795 [Photobacterium kishitanii]